MLVLWATDWWIKAGLAAHARTRIQLIALIRRPRSCALPFASFTLHLHLTAELSALQQASPVAERCFCVTDTPHCLSLSLPFFATSLPHAGCVPLADVHRRSPIETTSTDLLIPPAHIMADYYSSASSLEWDSASGGDTSDVDSTFGETRSTHTQSVTSSAYEFRFEHGRRYHAYKDGQYNLPNDETEQDRLDLQHHLFRLTLDGDLYFAPLPKHTQRAIDVGCGTGIWTIDFADQHPEIQVLGVDLSPIQPDNVPTNCHFRVDDVEADWIHTERFDFIHSRAMIGALRNWPRFFEQSYKQLSPGGIIELHDLCFPPRCDDPAAAAQSKSIEWANKGISATKRLGMDAAAPLRWVENLRAAGFVDIHVKWINWPIGPWAKGKKNKVVGRWAMADMLEALKAPVKLFTNLLGYTNEEYELLIADVRKEYRDQKIHLYLPACFCWARKPYHTEEPAQEQTLSAGATKYEDAPPFIADTRRGESEQAHPHPLYDPVSAQPEEEPQNQSESIRYDSTEQGLDKPEATPAAINESPVENPEPTTQEDGKEVTESINVTPSVALQEPTANTNARLPLETTKAVPVVTSGEVLTETIMVELEPNTQSDIQK